jgi:hypothetical protein
MDDYRVTFSPESVPILDPDSPLVALLEPIYDLLQERGFEVALGHSVIVTHYETVITIHDGCVVGYRTDQPFYNDADDRLCYLGFAVPLSVPTCFEIVVAELRTLAPSVDQPLPNSHGGNRPGGRRRASRRRQGPRT